MLWTLLLQRDDDVQSQHPVYQSPVSPTEICCCVSHTVLLLNSLILPRVNSETVWPNHLNQCTFNTKLSTFHSENFFSWTKEAKILQSSFLSHKKMHLYSNSSVTMNCCLTNVFSEYICTKCSNSITKQEHFFLFYNISKCNSFNPTLFIPVKEIVHSSSPLRFNQLKVPMVRGHGLKGEDKYFDNNLRRQTRWDITMSTETADNGLRVRFRFPEAQWFAYRKNSDANLHSSTVSESDQTQTQIIILMLNVSVKCSPTKDFSNV